MKTYYKSTSEFKNNFKAGELKYLHGFYRYLNQDGTKLYCFNPRNNVFDAFAVIENMEFPIIKGLLPTYPDPLRSRLSLQDKSIFLQKSDSTETEKQTILNLIITEEKNRRLAVHVLAQGSRSSKCNLNKLPIELLGEIACGFFYSTADKLTSKLQKLNEKDTYCGFKPGFLLGKRF